MTPRTAATPVGPTRRASTPPRSAGVGLLAAAGLSLLAACGETAKLPDEALTGPRPTLAEPNPTLVPTVNIAPAEPWPAGTQPQPAPGTRVSAFATGLQHPRWLHVLPNGDVLVAETNAPKRPEAGKGIKGWVMKKVMARAGAATPSANRITLLRDADGDGRPETREVFLQGPDSPFGMALVGDRFYVAHTDSVWEYAYKTGDTRITDAGRKITDLPAGPLNHHWTKALIASPDGTRLYATVGSNSNVAENGMAAEEGRAAIWEIERASGNKRLFATGLRNPNGMAWTTRAGGPPTLWTVVNERDEIGSDLVPDYLTSVQDGGFYGWPYSWYGQHVDTRVKPPQPDLVARAIVPDYALGSHVAPLGLAAAPAGRLSTLLAAPTRSAAAGGPASTPGAAAPAAGAATSAGTATPAGMFVGLHGSWNRRPLSGYKVVFVPFADGKPQGLPVDVLTGFLNADGRAHGRPVGVAVDARGALLVADDVGNTVWRLTPG